ncbi:MAG: DUF1080 domain-containing protein [Phycisphaerae bacterium]|nr:DUF1080 domain-containing protein [Phycisphaerae bacterium]
MKKKSETLFNGKDLSGWQVKCLTKDRDKEFWKVNDSVIECNSLGKPDHDYVWLQSEKEFDNFQLQLKFQVFHSSKGNSGVQFRSRYDQSVSAPKGGWLNGPQVDIHPATPLRTGLIYDETHGVNRWICPSLKNSAMVVSKAPKGAHVTKLVYADNDLHAWNTLKLVCDGMKIQTWVNNNKVCDFDGTGLLDDQKHKTCNVGIKGHIALQLHNRDELLIRYKDIIVTPIQ